MADQGLELQHRKVDPYEAELLASDEELMIGDEDLLAAEQQLNLYRCARCKADFIKEFGSVCPVDQMHAYCITCVYKTLIWYQSCPSGMHCTLDSEKSAWRFSQDERTKACNVTFMMDLLPNDARDHLKSGNEQALSQALGMMLGEYLEGQRDHQHAHPASSRLRTVG